jgi:hypothetical protein
MASRIKTNLGEDVIRLGLVTFKKHFKSSVPSPEDGWYKIETPFTRGNSDLKIVFYAFHAKDSKDIMLSDGGKMIHQLQKFGALQYAAIQTLGKTFGLSLMEDLSIMDISDRPLGIRIMAMAQGLIAIDGIVRTWMEMKSKE